MNVVIRVITNKRSLILKQSRPYVNKYQDIPAPLGRIDTEYQFYKSLDDQSISHYYPKVIGYNSEEYLLALEDLGQCQDMSYIYKDRKISKADIRTLVRILKELHNLEPPKDFPLNIELRKLNHQHIFVLPFQEMNGFNLDSIQKGLQGLSLPYKIDDSLKKEITYIGKLYLSSGDTLIHGDYYPGSWMKSDKQLYVLDPEFSFIGFKEFDLGVMAAHLQLSGMRSALTEILKIYNEITNTRLTIKIAGIEIIRRLIGLAQLPINLSLEEKDMLLSRAYEMIMSPQMIN